MLKIEGIWYRQCACCLIWFPVEEIGWSYDLLPEEERRAFRGLSVFAGGFSLAAMAAVCCGGDQAAALDLVDQLAGKSLVVAEPAAGGSRYRLLETIRQYAAERLAEAGEAGQARRRHAGTFLGTGTTAASGTSNSV